MNDGYRERMDQLIDRTNGLIDLMNLAPAFRGFQIRTTEADLDHVAGRLDELAKRIRETREAYVKRKAMGIVEAEADARIDAFLVYAGPASRRAAEPEAVS